jgi:hypothetical protein
VISGQLISEVTPLPAGDSPLVQRAAGQGPPAPAVRRATRSPLLPALAAGLAVLALLGLGAARELRGGPNWRALRFGS